MSKLKILLVVLMFSISFVSYADLIKPGETKSLTVNAYAGEYGWEWDCANLTLHLSPAANTCKVYCAAKFSGTAYVVCKYKSKYGTSIYTNSQTWAFTCNTSGEGEDTKILVSWIELNKTYDELEIGNTTQLAATVYPSNATNKTVGWVSNNYAVASVVNGLVTAKSVGTAVITCIANDSGNAKAQCTIKVMEKDIQVSSIQLNKTSDELEVGKTAQLTATVYPSNATNQTVNWTSSNNSVATVSTSGLVTAKSAGTTTITCSANDSGDAKATCSITVNGDKFIDYDGIRYKVIGSRSLSVYPLLNSQRYKGDINIPSSITYEGINYKVEEVGPNAFYACSELNSITMPNTITKIESQAFYFCGSDIPISIPNSVTTIGDKSFMGSYITSITIPKSVTKIGKFSFSYCKNLIGINVDSANENYYAVDGVLFNKSKDMLIQFPAGKSKTRYSIPATVAEVSEMAFFGCKNLKYVIIPNSVKIIENKAFLGCEGLDSITIDNSTPPLVCTILFANISEEAYYERVKLLVPSDAIDTYKAHSVWGKFKTIEAIPDNSLHSLGEALEKAATLAYGEYSEQYVVDFEPVVTFVGGAAYHIASEGKYSIIYKGGLGLLPGQTVKKGWKAKLYNFNGILELVPVEDEVISGGTIGSVPEPVVIRNANEINNSVLSAVVDIENVVFTSDTPGSRSTFTGKIGNVDVQFYNNYSVPSHPAGTYRVRATIGSYRALQVQPIEFIKVNSVDAVEDDHAPAKYYDLKGVPVDRPSDGDILIRKQGKKIEKVIFSEK